MKDNEELRGILNSGHTKAAAHVIRNVEINCEILGCVGKLMTERTNRVTFLERPGI